MLHANRDRTETRESPGGTTESIWCYRKRTKEKEEDPEDEEADQEEQQDVVLEKLKYHVE